MRRVCKCGEGAASRGIDGDPEEALPLQKGLSARTRPAPSAITKGHNNRFTGPERAALHANAHSLDLLDQDVQERAGRRMHSHVFGMGGFCQLRDAPVGIRFREDSDGAAHGNSAGADCVSEAPSAKGAGYRIAGRL